MLVYDRLPSILIIAVLRGRLPSLTWTFLLEVLVSMCPVIGECM